MILSDWIAIIAGGTQIAAAIIIAVIQHKQEKDMDAFTKHQDERDEKRYAELVHAEALEFLSRNTHVNDKQLLPLCAIANNYNPTFPYRREIYKDYCCLSNDVKAEIMKICNIPIQQKLLPYEAGKTFYDKCYSEFLQTYKCYLPNENDLKDGTIYYENGKYLERTILNHHQKQIPDYRTSADRTLEEFKQASAGGLAQYQEFIPLDSHISNELAYHRNEKPVSSIFFRCQVTVEGNPESQTGSEGDEQLACYEACKIARYIAIYSHNKITDMEPQGDYYIGDYNGTLYFEDLFLETLFEIFNNLISE